MNDNDNKKMDPVLEKLCAIVESLPEHHRQVLEMRYGLFDGTPSSYETIAEKLAFSVEKVKELETEALRMMRKPGDFATPDKSDATQTNS